MSFALAQYRITKVETASPVRLVVDLYRGALRYMRQALVFDGEGKIAERGVVLGKAHAVVSELMATLDHDKAPALCQELESLYDFVLHRITDANLKSDFSILNAAIDVMGTLESAWAEIAGQAR